MLFEAKKINIASKEYGIKMSKADAGRLSLALIFIAIIILPLTRMVLYINNKSIMLVVNSAMFGEGIIKFLYCVVNIINCYLIYWIYACVVYTAYENKT